MEQIEEIDRNVLVHRRAVKVWKLNNRDRHLEHRRREYIWKKTKLIYLNILL
jgi:hypothetical protein